MYDTHYYWTKAFSRPQTKHVTSACPLTWPDTSLPSSPPMQLVPLDSLLFTYGLCYHWTEKKWSKGQMPLNRLSFPSHTQTRTHATFTASAIASQPASDGRILLLRSGSCEGVFVCERGICDGYFVTQNGGGGSSSSNRSSSRGQGFVDQVVA